MIIYADDFRAYSFQPPISQSKAAKLSSVNQYGNTLSEIMFKNNTDWYNLWIFLYNFTV